MDELPVVELPVEELPMGVLVEPVREAPNPDPVELPTVPVVSRVAMFRTSSRRCSLLRSFTHSNEMSQSNSAHWVEFQRRGKHLWRKPRFGYHPAADPVR
jgi:hypothetical protein